MKSIMPKKLLSLVTYGLLLLGASSLAAQQGQQQMADLGKCMLESGKVIEHCKIGYRTYGTFSPDRNNVVLMPTWLYGKSGELASLFGDKNSKQRLVDTTRFFGVAVDAFGNGISSSPSNGGAQGGVAFPEFSTKDMVQAQFRLLTEVLKVNHLHAVVGLSMGGEQAFAWAVWHPEFVDLAVPIIGTPQLTPYDLQTKQIMLGAIRSDPDYHDGRYTKQPALRLANLYNVQVVTSPEYRNTHTSRAEFDRFVQTSESPVNMDANDRVWQLEAVTTHDVLRGKTIAEVSKQTPVKFFIIVNVNDRMVTPTPALEWATATHAPSYVSQKSCGHIIMSCDGEVISDLVQGFLGSE